MNYKLILIERCKFIDYYNFELALILLIFWAVIIQIQVTMLFY